MRRKPLAAMLVLLSEALVLGGNALLDAGWGGSALRSIADRVLPNPEIAMWAPAPEPGSHASSYADATGAGGELRLPGGRGGRQGQCPRAPAHLLRAGVGRRGLARDRGARRLGRALPRVRRGRGTRGCA